MSREIALLKVTFIMKDPVGTDLYDLSTGHLSWRYVLADCQCKPALTNDHMAELFFCRHADHKYLGLYAIIHCWDQVRSPPDVLSNTLLLEFSSAITP